MLCKSHLQDQQMRCPNRCSDDVFKPVKVQRVVLNQLMGVEIKCHLCGKYYEYGEKETHFVKYCDEVVFNSCVFKDCKQFEPCKREEFERHVLLQCGTSEKLCKTCDLDIYKIYENDSFREAAKGRICHRDTFLFFVETLV